jgi:hypothetical protein
MLLVCAEHIELICMRIHFQALMHAKRWTEVGHETCHQLGRDSVGNALPGGPPSEVALPPPCVLYLTWFNCGCYPPWWSWLQVATIY